MYREHGERGLKLTNHFLSTFEFYVVYSPLRLDTERFLEVTSKDAKLSKAAVKEKASILEQIASLRREYSQLCVFPSNNDGVQNTSAASGKRNTVVPLIYNPLF